MIGSDEPDGAASAVAPVATARAQAIARTRQGPPSAGLPVTTPSEIINQVLAKRVAAAVTSAAQPAPPARAAAPPRRPVEPPPDQSSEPPEWPPELPGSASPPPRVLRGRPIAPEWNPEALALESPNLDWNSLLPVSGGGNSILYGQIIDDSSSGSPSGSASPAFSVQTFSSGSMQAPDVPTIIVTILGLNSTETIPVGTWIFGINQFSDPGGDIYYEATMPMWLA
jgi:hypothetical protein